MFRNILAAGAAALVMSAAGAAHAEFYHNGVTTYSGTKDEFGILRNAGSPDSADGIVEVGGYAYNRSCGCALDYVETHGLVDMAITYESGDPGDYPDPIPAHTFLTFDVIYEGAPGPQRQTPFRRWAISGAPSMVSFASAMRSRGCSTATPARSRPLRPLTWIPRGWTRGTR